MLRSLCLVTLLSVSSGPLFAQSEPATELDSSVSAPDDSELQTQEETAREPARARRSARRPARSAEPRDARRREADPERPNTPLPPRFEQRGPSRARFNRQNDHLPLREARPSRFGLPPRTEGPHDHGAHRRGPHGPNALGPEARNRDATRRPSMSESRGRRSLDRAPRESERQAGKCSGKRDADDASRGRSQHPTTERNGARRRGAARDATRDAL